MASKTVKRSMTSATTSSVSSTQSPFLSPSSSTRPQSPLSPTRISRLQEKEELGHLNDRLASYIDRVRHLELENNRLTVQVQTTQETITKEVTNVKSMYENELSDARKLLDVTAKEKARLQIECSKYISESEDLKARLEKRDKEFLILERNVSGLEARLQDLQSRFNQVSAEKKKLDDLVKELKAENEKLAKQLAGIKKQLDDETLQRVDFQNRVQSLREEMSFKQQVYDKELTETRTRKQVEISEIDDRLQEQYQQKLSETLTELREQYESQMRANREEIESLYDGKMEQLKQLNEQSIRAQNSMRDDLLQTKSRCSSLQSRVGEVEAQNSSLLERVRDLEKMLEDERALYSANLKMKQEEIDLLQNEMTIRLQDYRDLMDIKVALDMEISAYRKLLEGEEARLNITPKAGESRQGTPIRRTIIGRAAKRKRAIMSHSDEKSVSNYVSKGSAKGYIEILEQDIEGKFVKLTNKGEEDISIGGWQLIRKAGDQQTIFKFHRSVILKPGQFSTVWSSDAGTTHSPPTDLVMKGQHWAVGQTMVTVLVNNNGEELAVRETTHQVMSSSNMESSDQGGYLEDEGDPESRERCAIM